MTNPASAEDTTLRLTRTFNAPRDRVFSAFIDPAAMHHWMAPAPLEITCEPLERGVGANARFTMRSADGDQ